MREHRQSSAGKGRRATPRNGCPAQPGSGTVPRRAAVAYRECDAGVARWSIRGLVCDLGRAIADASALQRAGELYAARGIELEGAGRDGGALCGLRPVIWPRSSDSVDASGRHARAKEWTWGRTAPPLVVAQIAISFLILVAAGLFVRTLNNLHSVQLGYARENILLFSLNARQAGHRDPEIAIFYADLRKRFESIPGVSSATLSQSSIINAGRAGQAIRGPMKIGAVTLDGARVMSAGPRFLTTMQIPILAGREIDDRDQPGSRPIAVISERLARTYFGNENPVGRRITLPDEKRDLEVSSPGESHPEALSEPYLNLSAHTAPAMEPRRTPICQ